MNTTFLILFWVMVAIFVVHAYLALKKKGSIIDYFLAGGNLKLGPFSASLAATNLSLGNFIFLGAIWGYFYGFSALLWLFIGFVLLAIGFLAYAPYLKSFIEYKKNTGTVHEYIAETYTEGSSGLYKKRIRLLASFATIITLIIATALELHLGALIASNMLGGSPFLWFVGLLISIAVYSAIGGYRAVIFTDILQGALLFLGLLVIIYLLFISSDMGVSWSTVTSVYPTSADHIFSDFEWHNMLSFAVIGFGWFLVTVDTWQRNSATRSIETSKKGIISGTAILYVFIAVYALIGMYDQSYILPKAETIEGFTHSGGLHPINDFLHFGLAGTALEQIIMGFLAVSFVMAAISTADTFLIVCSYSFTGDVLVGVRSNKELGDLNQEESEKYITVGMIATVLMSFLIIAVWLLSNSLGLLADPLTLFFIAYSVQFSLLSPVLFSVRKSLAHPFIAFVSIICGIVVTLSMGIFSAYMLTNGIEGAWSLRADQWLALSPVAGVAAGVIPFLPSLLKGGK